MINISDAIKYLKKEVPNPTKGLPEDLFYYISSTTPIINVDLLLKDKNPFQVFNFIVDNIVMHCFALFLVNKFMRFDFLIYYLLINIIILFRTVYYLVL